MDIKKFKWHRTHIYSHEVNEAMQKAHGQRGSKERRHGFTKSKHDMTAVIINDVIKLLMTSKELASQNSWYRHRPFH